MVLQMATTDYVSLALASVIVAFVVFREVRDINIGRMMLTQAKARDREKRRLYGDSVRAEQLDLSSSHAVWVYLLGVPVSFRRYFILPFVIETVVLMVLRMGGDTVSVMLNTMATLCAATDRTRSAR